MPKHIPFLFLLISMFILQSIDIKAQNEIAKKADSLFNANNYTDAAKLYETLLNDELINKENMFLKLAYIYENQKNNVKAIYYLNSYYNLQPKDEIFEKMNQIALENKFEGFERNDINFILMLYQQYYYYFLIILLAISVFVMYIMINKVQDHQKISLRQKLLIAFLLFILITMINMPNRYSSGIVKKSCFYRSFASSAAPLEGQISMGNKINIFGKTDIWYQVLWKKNLVFINQKDIWVLKN